MTPGMRLLRRLLLLPVQEAERREEAVRATGAAIRHEERRLSQAHDRLVRRSSELRTMFDDLLGRLDDD